MLHQGKVIEYFFRTVFGRFFLVGKKNTFINNNEECDFEPDEKGFSLMELLLVVIIIGLIIAMVIPKLIQFRIEARYEIVGQTCVELNAAVEQWVQKSMAAQDDRFSSAIIRDYVATLADREPAQDPFAPASPISGQWLATALRPNNWNNNNIQRDLENQLVSIPGRRIGNTKNAPPESVVEDMIPSAKVLKNPFNGINIFRRENDPQVLKQPVAGALAFTSVLEGDGILLYAFCFQGRDSTTLNWELTTTFHDGQNLLSKQGIKHCSIFAQYR